jgi:hypothetical protein
MRPLSLAPLGLALAPAPVRADARRPLSIGAGVRLGATSGYADVDTYLRAPFDPVWSSRLAPTVRAHAAFLARWSDDCDGRVRFELADVIVDGNTIGVRAPSPQRVSGDATWMLVSLGVAIRT